MIIGIANAAIGRLRQALKMVDDKLVIRLDPQEIAARYLLWQRHTPPAAKGEAGLLGPGRQGVRKELRDKLTNAEVERHQQRYYPG